jgi:hypothetical protein
MGGGEGRDDEKLCVELLCVISNWTRYIPEKEGLQQGLGQIVDRHAFPFFEKVSGPKEQHHQKRSRVSDEEITKKKRFKWSELSAVLYVQRMSVII